MYRFVSAIKRLPSVDKTCAKPRYRGDGVARYAHQNVHDTKMPTKKGKIERPEKEKSGK